MNTSPIREMLEVSTLCKSFSNVQAVNNINFTIKQGDVLAFPGPNGAEKTTTIRILPDIIKADKGDINWNLNGWAICRCLWVNLVRVSKYMKQTCRRTPVLPNIFVFFAPYTAILVLGSICNPFSAKNPSRLKTFGLFMIFCLFMKSFFLEGTYFYI